MRPRWDSNQDRCRSGSQEAAEQGSAGGERSSQCSMDARPKSIEYRVEREVLDGQRLEEVAQRRMSQSKPTAKDRLRDSMRCSVQRVKDIILGCLPLLSWLPRYPVREYALGDLVSGLSVGIMHLPQGMAYALLASVPPVFGLYTSFYPVLVYILFGTSRHISVGTFAVVSIMVGSVTEQLAPDSMFLTNSTNSTGELDIEAQDLYKVKVAAATTLLVGVLQVLLGLVHFGFVVTYLSQPLVRAYTTGAAMHVVVSQLKYMFGVKPQRYSGVLSLVYTVIDVCSLLPETNLPTLVVTVVSLVVMITVKELNSAFRDKLFLPIPIELIVIAIATLISVHINLCSHYDVHVVGQIPSGLQPPRLPDVGIYKEVIGHAFAIVIVSYAINISLGKTFALKHGYKVDSNQELIAVGFCNAVGGFFQCFAVTSSMSRSLVQESTGGQTQMAGAVAAFIVLITVLKLGPLFEQLPKAVLATIVFVNLKGMFMQCQDIPQLWRTNKIDLLIWLVTFISTVTLNLDLGLAASISFALLMVIFKTQLPRYSLLGRVSNTDIYLDVETFKEAKEIPGITIFRSSTTIYFANAELYLDALQEKSGLNLNKLIAEKKKKAAKLKRQMKKMEKEAKKEAKKQKGSLKAVVEGGFFSVEKEVGCWTKCNGQEDVLGEKPKAIEQEKAAQEAATCGMVNWGYQTEGACNITKLECGNDNVDSKSGTPCKGPSTDSVGIHSIILDLSTASFLDTVAISTLKNIFRDFGEIDVDVYMAGCQSYIVEQLETGGFFSPSLQKEQMFVSVHDAVLYSLQHNGESATLGCEYALVSDQQHAF